MTTEYPKRNHWETSHTVQDFIMLKIYIRKYFLVFTCACALLFIVCAYYYQKHTEYSSRVTFLVNSSSLAEVLWDRNADGPMEVVNDDQGYNRINQIIYSSRMIDFLIEKFDLYSHYQIPKELANSYFIVSSKIKENLKVWISKTRIITVEVTDRLDYNVAANMANAIGNKINEINRQITMESLTRKTEIFESLSKDLRSNSQHELSQMDSLMKSMQRFLAVSVKDEGYRQLLNLNIENLQSKSEDYIKDLFESYKYRLYSMYSLQDKNLPSISVLEKALPNKYSKSGNSYIVYPLIFIFSIMIPLFFTYMIIKTGPVLSYVFKHSSVPVIPKTKEF